MNTENSNAGLAGTRLLVSVERHLRAELSLLEELDSLNQVLKVTLETSGSGGPSIQQSEELHSMTEALSKHAEELKEKRGKTLEAIKTRHPNSSPPLSIREYILTLDSANSQRLESLRISILDRLTEIHATLVGNQAVMFYSHEFYRKMVAGLLNSNLDENCYLMTGQQSTVKKPGNLIRKAC